VRRSLLPIALAVAFGAADQFLGARAWVVGSWATDASLLSAPWLLVAFVAGRSQATAKRAVILGFVCTIAALVGYWAMTLSPIEGAVVTLRGIRGLLVGQSAYAVGGVATGPFFGWLGYRWRTERDWASALAVALVVCCEPLAHAAAGAAVSFDGVWAAEVVFGLAMALYVVAVARRRTAR
jgi:uncharacterized membrane protein (UPF0136 family)